MNDLKPCPFCGGEAELFQDVSFHAETGEEVSYIKYFAWCTECSALVSGDTKEEAQEAWNRRVEGAENETS